MPPENMPDVSYQRQSIFADQVILLFIKFSHDAAEIFVPGIILYQDDLF